MIEINSKRVTSFTDLMAWKVGHELVLLIYKLTKNYPHEEIYGLTSQSRRCAVSITSNIAEGFSRQGKQEKIQFYYISKGSITELQNQLIIAKDLKYIITADYKLALDLSNRVQQLISGLIWHLKQNT